MSDGGLAEFGPQVVVRQKSGPKVVIQQSNDVRRWSGGGEGLKWWSGGATVVRRSNGGPAEQRWSDGDTDRISRILAPYASLCAHGTRTDVLIAPEQNSSDPEQNIFQISNLSSFQISQTLTESLRI
ncbi:hypothetical protein MA16_Dca002805 [Dendrobium catenatum]|uniref:Uncharacterized protein n=1 Tax=Dendrobium catenatum TaxID=906689 RepID=A0A2I0X8R4_9ASPA|nr:hypothetical protein MA16_Dca002805 [Dendrobium catenatum]